MSFRFLVFKALVFSLCLLHMPCTCTMQAPKPSLFLLLVICAMLGRCLSFGKLSSNKLRRVIPYVQSSSIPLKQRTLVLWSNNISKGKDGDFSTWEYKPYKAPLQRRVKSDYEWKVPQKITIPEDRLEISFARSSGAGGQNVNKGTLVFGSFD